MTPRRNVLLLLLAAASLFGGTQSPIDIRSENSVFSALPPLNFNYSSSADLTWTNINSPDVEGTIRAVVPAGSYVSLSGVDYQLLQFHFHEEAEHLVNGHHYDMEMHFVNKAADNTLLVVGRFITIGAFNAALDPLFSSIPAHNLSTPVNGFNIAALLPTTQTTYRYDGSLTTSPYSEGVKWNVFSDESLEMSQAQVDAFTALFPNGNFREPQSLDGRTILTDVPGFAAPEPGSLILMSCGGLALVAIRLRKRAA